MTVINMDSWLCEKAMRQVSEAAEIVRWIELVPGDAVCPWPDQTVREYLVGQARSIYHHACLIIAYAVGDLSGESLKQPCMDAFDTGDPAAMVAAAERLEETEHDGWELPNPNHHTAMLAWPP